MPEASLPPPALPARASLGPVCVGTSVSVGVSACMMNKTSLCVPETPTRAHPGRPVRLLSLFCRWGNGGPGKLRSQPGKGQAWDLNPGSSAPSPLLPLTPQLSPSLLPRLPGRVAAAPVGKQDLNVLAWWAGAREGHGGRGRHPRPGALRLRGPVRKAGAAGTSGAPRG